MLERAISNSPWTMMEPISFSVVEATIDHFLEDGYLSENPDVRVAVGQGNFDSGLGHFLDHGSKEGRRQRSPNGPLKQTRMTKIERLTPFLRRDMPRRSRNGKLDFLTGDLRTAAGIIEVENVSSHNYDPAALGLIAKHADGLILDCGAGRRDVYFPNVVNYEIVDYDTTDVLGVGESLPFVDSAFDAVFSLAVLEHVRDPFRCAKEISRVLKPGGDLYCCVPFLQPVHGYPHHYFNATPQGLRRLFEDDMALDETAKFTPIHPIFALSWILNSWSNGLPEDLRADFMDLRVGALMQDPPKLLGAPFVAQLAREKQFELACATIMRTTKREKAMKPPGPRGAWWRRLFRRF